MQINGRFFDAANAADAGTNQYARTFGIGVGDFQAGIVHRHIRRCQAVMDEDIHLFDIFRRQERFRIEPAHFTGNAGVVSGCVEMADRTNTGTAVADRIPGTGQIISDRRDDAHAGNDNATLAHGQPPNDALDNRAQTHRAAQARPR